MGLCVRALDIFQVCGLVAVGTVVGKRSVGAEAVFIDVEADGLCQYTMTTDMGIAGDADELLCGLVGNDIDDTCNGIGAIERRGGAIEDLDAFHSAHIDTVQVNIV